MTVSEVLKNVDKSLVHFAIFESINSNKSMYENIDTITKQGKKMNKVFNEGEPVYSPKFGKGVRFRRRCR